jgi:hypothetical protein
MTTPPKVTAADAAAACAAVRRRHTGRDDPREHLLTDDPRDVLRFLRGLGVSRLRDDDDDTARHDVEDGLTLRLFLWWEGIADEAWLLAASDRCGLRRRRVGAILGIRSSAGFADRLERDQALLDPARAATSPTQPAPARPATASAGDAALRELVGDAYARLDDLPTDIAEDVHDIRREAARTGPLDEPTRAAIAGIVRDLIAAGPDNPIPAATILAARYLGIPAGQPT